MGDNLYSDCILALDAKTGKLKWHYQTTPHDLWDWDATETPVVLDAAWQGQPRKLLIQANRNGFFYVFDRTDGKLLLAKPFVTQPQLGQRHRCGRTPGQAAQYGAERRRNHGVPVAGWRHQLVLAVLQSRHGPVLCADVREVQRLHQARSGGMDGGQGIPGRIAAAARGEKPQRILKAIDIRTGKIAWNLPQPGPAESWGGTLSTATGLVIFGEEGGALMAADAVTGKPLWSFQTNQTWKASPMTYQFDGKQYVAVAAGPNIIAFGMLAAVKRPISSRSESWSPNRSLRLPAAPCAIPA